MTLSPTERRELLANLAANLTAALRQEFDPAELATVDLATAGQMIGLGPKAAALKLPVIEVGPRSRRVSIADLNAFQERHKTYPKSWPKPSNSNAAS